MKAEPDVVVARGHLFEDGALEPERRPVQEHGSGVALRAERLTAMVETIAGEVDVALR